eukprot:6798739-Pyramimonas_sp.AAC.1
MRTPTQHPSTVAGWADGYLIAGTRAASRLSMLRTTSTNSQGAASDAPPASSINMEVRLHLLRCRDALTSRRYQPS